MEGIIADKILSVVTVDSVLAATLAKRLHEEIGVEKLDLQLVEPADLEPLKPIQIRKLIRAWKPVEVETVHTPALQSSATPCSPLPSGSPATSSSASASSSRASTPESFTWFLTYNIPLDLVPKPTKAALTKGKKLTKGARNKLIHIIMDDIVRLDKKPKRSALDMVATRLVYAYPASLQDTLDGKIVGSGHASLLRHLVTRAENMRREAAKRQIFSPEIEPKKSKDCYGCVNFSPEADNQDINALRQQQQDMRDHVLSSNGGLDIVSALKDTFALQRLDINGGYTVTEVIEEWPLLLASLGMEAHCHQLVGKPLASTLEAGLQRKILLLISYFEEHHLGSQQRRDVYLSMKANVKAGQPKHRGCGKYVLLLAVELRRDDLSAILQEVEIHSTKSDIVLKNLPMTPVMIAYVENL